MFEVFLPDIDVQYPIGIKRTAGNAEYTVAISEIRHSSLGHATATVFLRIHLTNKPEGQNKIYFAASGVPLTRNGGLQGDITLALVAPYTFSLGNDINITLLGAMNDGAIAEGSTSATVTCDGFKQLQLSAEVEFAGNLIKPADGSATMKSQFQTVVSDWNDIVADISLSPFEVQGLSNWVFSVENAIIDLSETQSSPNMLFPNSYQSEFPDAELKAFWKGVFIRDFSVLLPKSLSANEGLTNFIRGQNVLIDEHGFSGALSASPIFGLNQGTAGGWPLSMDELMLKFDRNNLTDGRFVGQIKLPVSESPLKYTGLLSLPNNYALTVAITDTMNFDLWKAATVQLDANSSVSMAFNNENGTFVGKAVLHGTVGMNIGQTNDLAKVEEFEIYLSA